jgi:hypothetical protein
MDLPLWARKFSQVPVRCSCNHFAEIADKVPCVVNGITVLSLCVCVYLSIYVCVYVYIYTNINLDLPLWAPKYNEVLVRCSCNHLVVTVDN